MIIENTEYEIVPLPREKWQGTPIPMRYTTTEYYDVVIGQTEKRLSGDPGEKAFCRAGDPYPGGV